MCTGECAICLFAGGCLAGHEDDLWHLATIKQIEERLAKGEYKNYIQLMKDTLKQLKEIESLKLKVNEDKFKFLKCELEVCCTSK